MSIPECYRKGEGSVYYTNGSDVPCGGSNPSGCCVHGSFCLESGICHDTSAGLGMSGYYMQSCTDESYAGSACPNECTDLQVPDVVYNDTSGLWSCCGYNATTRLYGCADPVDETFQAPSPQDLTTITSLALHGWTLGSSSSTAASSSTTTMNAGSTVTSSSSTSVGSSAASSSAASTSTPVSSADHSSGLSTGASAGIGISVALGTLALIGLLVWAILDARKRKRSRATPAGGYAPAPSTDMYKQDSYQGYKGEMDAGQQTYLSGLNSKLGHNLPNEPPSTERYEMQSQGVQPRYELDSSNLGISRNG